jgi:hypothetical protein
MGKCAVIYGSDYSSRSTTPEAVAAAPHRLHSIVENDGD